MELTITKKEFNPLLSRIEIGAVVKSDTTPSNKEVGGELAEQLKKAAELIIIKNIYQKYGQPESTVNAFVYDNKEALNKFEGVKEKKEEEKPKEEAKGGTQEGVGNPQEVSAQEEK